MDELTYEKLDRLEAAAVKQSGLEFGTTIPVMPGELLKLVRSYRESNEASITTNNEGIAQ